MPTSAKLQSIPQTRSEVSFVTHHAPAANVPLHDVLDGDRLLVPVPDAGVDSAEPALSEHFADCVSLGEGHLPRSSVWNHERYIVNIHIAAKHIETTQAPPVIETFTPKPLNPPSGETPPYGRVHSRWVERGRAFPPHLHGSMVEYCVLVGRRSDRRRPPTHLGHADSKSDAVESRCHHRVFR